MTKISFPELLMKAEECVRQHQKWHFHILTPTCKFNSHGKFTVMFENDETGEECFSLFDEKPLKDGEKLEALFYGRVHPK